MQISKISIFFVLLFFQNSLFSQNHDTKDNIVRINNIKKCTGRIIIDSVAVGTGFFISENGLVLTCWHVIDSDPLLFENGKIKSKIFIELVSKERIEIEVLDSLKETNKFGYLYDYIVLRAKNSNKKYSYFKLGNFDKCIEGSEVYTCGYPFAQFYPVYTQGVVSTIFNDTIFYYNDTIIKKSALLDITFNRGNSGGAVFLKGKKTKFDQLIGIADFIVVPRNTNELSELKKSINPYSMGSLQSGSFDLRDFAKSLILATENTSYGIGGIISVNYIKTRILK